MNQGLNDLKNTCDRSEKQLADVQERLSQLPQDSLYWFYLDPCKFGLCEPDLFEDIEVFHRKKTQTFVSRFELNQDIDFQLLLSSAQEKIREDDSQKMSQNSELHKKILESVLQDGKFPEPVKMFILQEGSDTSISLNELDVIAFCKYLLDSEVHLNDVTVTYLFSMILSPLICNSNESMLLEKIQEMSNKFPVPMMNAVIIPVVSRTHLEKQDLDIICHILSGLTKENLNAVLKSVLTSLKKSDEISLKILSTVMHKKPKLDGETAFILVTNLKNLSGQFSSSVHFGKILLNIIPQLNYKLCDAALKTLKEVVDHHSTFVKTPALNLFKGLVSA